VLQPDLVIRSRRVVTGGDVQPAAIHVRQGRIIGVMDYANVPDGPVDDASDYVVMPGVVDTHVHVNEPGRTEWEGFDTATRAAAAGGVTTIIDMPLNSIPATTTMAALEEKRRAADGKCFVDVGFWGGLVPGNVSELPALSAAGVFGFKCFLVPSGVDEFRCVTETDLRAAMPILAKLRTPLLVHAELPEPIDGATKELRAGHTWLARLSGIARAPQRYATYLATRPKEAENQAVALAIELCRQYRVKTHIVHLSSADALTPLYHARTSGVGITSETCPHYLSFVADEIPDRATVFKCAPPIRERENREYLWAALAGGLIQMVASDHSPSPPALKHFETGDFLHAWGGISSLQISLAATWTGARGRGYSLNQLADWMCRGPARLAGLDRKGAIDVGYDADLTVWDPDAQFTVEASSLLHRHAVTAYEGRRLHGIVHRTYVRGLRVYERGRGMTTPSGRLLSRSG
jgi:allantoinase